MGLRPLFCSPPFAEGHAPLRGETSAEPLAPKGLRPEGFTSVLGSHSYAGLAPS